MKLVVGLGNPGKKYALNRHNTGYMVLDELAKSKDLNWKHNEKLSCDLCKDGEILYIKPTSFMNSSGDVVAGVKNYYDVDVSDICVIHDDVDLPFGTVRTQKGAGHAGHRGVMDIIDKLGTKDFQRIRIGIGRPEENSKLPVDEFVLRDFTEDELTTIKKIGVSLSENL